ncbi:hypothetical protein TNCV_3557831 [Trichonephila clavipes]|uniref:Uncharacterized protein n=1 Tax=Trichonephila clavipes TaxID=2585209 RepID=A0A8X6WCK5_TRICX|nr:hypothetical protein TNCV_3557831 [Trichonephila clavipes]
MVTAELRYECITLNFMVYECEFFSGYIVFYPETVLFLVTRHDAGRRRAELSPSPEESTFNVVANRPESSTECVFSSDEAHFCLNGYVNKQNCRIWSEANPQVYVETPLHPEKLTVWCALWAGGILLQKR